MGVFWDTTWSIQHTQLSHSGIDMLKGKAGQAKAGKHELRDGQQ